ncbi:MAG: cyclase/dehydrase [Frankiales bacterium]|jgi:carbon monoxide dehydrogenase subunit G|nr:cyclase/dehydrase [Frankiales bacterium]
MADQASSSITIAAPLERVLAVIADIDSYPEWTGQIKSAEVVSSGPDGRPEQARFVMDAGVLKDEYVLAYAWRDDGVSWELVGKSAVQKSQVGSYSLAPAGEGTEVTYRLAVDIAMPMLGMFKRKAEKMIMDSALKELKKRVESQPPTAQG